jgi:hypothetical protein
MKMKTPKKRRLAVWVTDTEHAALEARARNNRRSIGDELAFLALERLESTKPTK